MGRVQIRYTPDDLWLPVCSRNNSALSTADSWDQKDVNVACKQLGYRGGWYKEYGRGHFPERYVTHIECVGGKSVLTSSSLCRADISQKSKLILVYESLYAASSIA